MREELAIFCSSFELCFEQSGSSGMGKSGNVDNAGARYASAAVHAAIFYGGIMSNITWLSEFFMFWQVKP